MARTSGNRLFITLATLLISLSGAVTAARAELITISAADFVLRCPCTLGAEDTALSQGVLVAEVASKFYRSVDLPNGQRVCSLALVYQDANDNDPVTLTLFEKRFNPGTSNAFNTPVAVASVESAPGISNKARRAVNSALGNGHKITEGSAFYYLELNFDTINMAALGAQIDVRESCPPV